MEEILPPVDFRKLLVIGVLLIDLAIIILVGIFISQSRTQYDGRATITTQNLSQVIEEYISGVVARIDVALLSVIDESERQLANGSLNRQAINTYLVRQRARIPELDGLRITNAKGEIVCGTDLTPGSMVNIADRNYFIRLRDDPKSGIVISKPIVGRVVGKWIISMARRLNYPDGSFAGVVFGTIALERFAETFARVNVGRHGVITLFNSELKVVSRYTQYQESSSFIGKEITTTELLELFKGKQDEGMYRAASTIDGIERIYFYRKISNYPLYIIVGLAVDDFLAEWRNDVSKMVALVALIFIITIFLAWMLYRHIAKRKAAEIALALSEERFRKLFEESPIGIAFLGKQREIILTNQRYRDFLGYSEAEIMELGPKGLLHPDDWEPSVALSTKLRSGEIPLFHMEQRYIQKNGAVVWADTQLTVLRDKDGKLIQTIGWVQDITERKRVEAERTLLATAIEQAAEVVVITDSQGAIQYVNPAFELTTGYSRWEALGQNPRVLKSGEHNENFYKAMWETISSGKTWKGRLTNKRKNGSYYIEEATISPVLDPAGIIKNYVAVKRDITREIDLEAQFIEAQKMEAVGQLAGGIAHDFNNILSAIMGYAYLVQTRMGSDDPSRDDVAQILESVHRAAEVTHSLLAFSKKQSMNPKLVLITDIVKRSEKLLSRVIGEDISVSTAIACNEVQCMVDAGQIEQVLMNLATNARDAMPKGGRLTISTECVEMDEYFIQSHGYGRLGRFALISVSDTGVGMKKETIAKIFEPFFTTKETGKGTGLGLAMADGIIKQHGGYIDVFSESDKGTTFNIYLPAVERLEEEMVNPIESMPSGGTETILVAEDEEKLRQLYETILEQQGYKVILAQNGEDAIEQFIDNKDGISLVLLDMIMPKKSGKEVYDAIKEIRPDMKVIFISGYTADRIDKENPVGEDLDFIFKPVLPKDLLKKLRAMLDK